MKAAQGGLAEVAMGQMAADKASSADVKAFGQRMVTDHGAANGELTQLALQKGLVMPSEPATEHKSASEHLASLSGSAFDKAYIAHMVEDHEKDVKAFDEASRTATDSEVKTWAAAKLPTLQDHLKSAKEIQRKMK